MLFIVVPVNLVLKNKVFLWINASVHPHALPIHETRPQPHFCNSSHLPSSCVPPTLSVLLCCTPAHRTHTCLWIQILRTPRLPSLGVLPLRSTQVLQSMDPDTVLKAEVPWPPSQHKLVSQQAAPSTKATEAGERGCSAWPPTRAAFFRNKHCSGWGRLQYRGSCPHAQRAGHLFVHSPQSYFQPFSPCQETLFLAASLLKALATLCLLLCTHLLILFTSCFIYHHLQIV